MQTTLSSSQNSSSRGQDAFGVLAFGYCGKRLPLKVLESAGGFYLGTFSEGPFSRESVEYFETAEIAEQALRDGTWSQKQYP